MGTSDFLSDFFEQGKRVSKSIDPTTKNTLRHDRWDREDLRSVMSEIDAMRSAQDDLTNITETAPGAIEDTFFGLMKAEPALKDAADVRPSYMVNHTVMGVVMELNEMERLRLSTTGDMIAAGLAVADMEPQLEKLFDQLQDAQDQANAIQQMSDGMVGLGQEYDDAEKMMADMIAKGGQPSDAEMEDLQAQQDRIQEAMDLLEKQMNEAKETLQNSLRDAAPQIQDHMKEALGQAQEQADAMDNMSAAWGLESGSVQRLPAKRRIELAQRMKSQDKFKKLAELIGPMQRLALSEQARRTTFAREEVYDVEIGNDIMHLLPQEYALLDDEIAELDFLRRFNERQLMQYKLRGVEKVARGDIFYCEDGSGSMGGDREVWAKAVGLALQQIAYKQGRTFTGVHFGSPNEYVTFEFQKDGSAWIEGEGGSYNRRKEYPREHYERIEAVMFFAELFFAGGTDFVTPLSVCLEKLQKQHAEFGAVKGDIVFVTDGMCGVDDSWLKEFKAEQARLGFRIWGIIIDGMPQSEPLNTICDGHVWSIGDLLNGADVAQIFREI